MEEVLGAPQVAGVLTRLMCSSFTDGAAAVVARRAGGSDRPVRPDHRLGGPFGLRQARLPRPPRRGRPRRLGDASASARRTSTSSSSTTPRAPRSCFALESLGIFAPGEAGPATLAGDTAIGGQGDHGEPERRPRRPRASLGGDRDRPGRRARDPARGAGPAPARSRAPGSALAVNTGGVIDGDAGFVGMHALGAGLTRAAASSSAAGASPSPTRSSPTTTWRRRSTRATRGSPSGPASGSDGSAARPRRWPTEAGQSGARAGRASTRRDIDVLVLATTTPDAIVPATAATVQELLGIGGRGLRPQRRVLGVRVRPGRCAPAWSRRGRPGAAHRRRHPEPDHRLGRPHDRRAGRRRRRRGGARGDRRARATCSAGTCTPTARCGTFSIATTAATSYMDGKEIFRQAVRVVVDSAEQALGRRRARRRRHRTCSSPTRPTSASSRPPASASGIPEERTAVVIDRYGNTSSASIPLALDDAVDNGRVHDGDLCS